MKTYIKFVISGGTAGTADLILLYVLTDIVGLWYLISATIAFVVAFLISFFLQKFWTFRDNRRTIIYKQLSLYLVVGLTNLSINGAAMYLLVDKFGIWYMLAQVISSGFLAFINFLVYKFIIFKKCKEEIKNKNNEYDNNLKILIATGIFPPDLGGPATMLEALIYSLEKQDIKVKVITYSDSKLNSGNKIIKINRKQNSLKKLIKYFLKMRKLSTWADIIYATDTYSVGYFAYLIKKITGKKYIIRFAGDSAWETAVSKGWTDDYIVDFQKKVYNKEIEKLKERRKKIIVNADKIIAVSKFIGDIAETIGASKDKVKVIYNSMDFMKNTEVSDREVIKIKNKYGQNSKIIITSCRLTSWKGVDGIIKIMPELVKNIGKVNFLVLGDGPELDNLKALSSKLDLRNNVYFLGRLPEEETYKYFKAADLYILNTNYEAMSHALLNVMRYETPIITTNIGGNPEVIENNKEGILINYNNKEELLRAAKKILSNPEWAKQLALNANKKLEKFNWIENIDSTVKLLNDVNYEKSSTNKSSL
ncbi:MAG: glycosyltransferase [Patescibacteria group bacterium]